MHKVILDVDTGIDDAIAIMLAIASKDIEILGITVTSGNIHVNQGIINTKRILKVLDREDIKVYRGSEKPLNRPLVDASHIHGKDGLSGQLLDIQVNEQADGCAFEFLEEVIREYQSDVTLIMTGPLTNLARFIERDPNIHNSIKKVIAMGGAIDLKGNASLVAEFNIMTDPEAAYQCVHQGFEAFHLISLDVTREALINKDDLQRIESPRIRKIVEGLTSNYMDRYYGFHGHYGSLMHDPLTILFLLKPSLIKYEKKYVTVERFGEFTAGMTLCDEGDRYEKQKNIFVSRKLDSKAFKEVFIDLMNALN